MDTVERRRSILMAAKSVFAAKGYHAAWVADIVDEAGIARGTFYLYFKSKQDVFAALMDYTFELLRERLIAIPTDEPEQILISLLGNIDRAKEFFSDEPELARVIMSEATSPNPESSERVQEIKDALAARLVELIRQWQEVGILKQLDAHIVTYCFLGAIRELIEQSLLGRAEWNSDQITEALMNVFLFGLTAPEYNQMAGDHLEEIGRPGISPQHSAEPQE